MASEMGGFAGADPRDEVTPHEELRQEILSHEPEGREPTPRVRRMSWMVFHTVLIVCVSGFIAFLWLVGGLPAVIIGSALTFCAYIFAYGAQYAAVAHRLNDKHKADLKAQAIKQSLRR